MFMNDQDIGALCADWHGMECVTDSDQLKRLSRDFSWFSPVLKERLDGMVADLLVRPASEEDVVRVVRSCAGRRVPLTLRGAGTGNYGQCTPLRGGVVMDMTRLNGILWVRPGAARVQSGARLHAIDTEARRIGWEQRLLPSTFRLATAGGYVAGGCCGIGSIAHGALKDPGNFLGARVVSVEKTPRIRELRGEAARDLHHSYGVNGIMTELELALAPAHDWHEFIVCFDDFMDAAHFARRVGEADGIAKRLVTVLAWPIPAYLTPLSAHLPTGRHAVILLIAESSVETFYELCSHAGGEVTYSKSAEELRAGGRTLIEYTWNHTTLYALKADKSMTYLQTGYRPERDLKTVERICRYFGDELMMHLEFIRADGAVTCSGLPLIRFSDEARLNEIIRYHEANGVFVANPHTYVIEDGGKKVIDPRQLRSKEELDPGGILNPGKLKAWDSHGPGAGEGAA